MASPAAAELLPRALADRAESNAPWQTVVSFLRRSRSLAVGGSIVLVISLLALFAPQLSPANPIEMNLSGVLLSPTAAHPLGTDDLGRDVLSRTLHGGRISLLVGVFAVAVALVVGSFLGLISGYSGGTIDNVVMRLLDAILAIPALLLAVGIAAALGPKLENVVIAVGLVYIPAFARLVRAQVLVVRQEDFVTAARLGGATWSRILRSHLLPNVTTPIIVLASLRVSSAIVAEASLSFLGLGAQPPTPTWGSMVNTGQRYLENAPWVAFGPGAAILLCILGLSILGEGVREMLDPHFQSRTGAGR
ncbi:MAG: ABC transporter permease [Planctomycetes bacterium]|nr:ABC transporter permease [Planctomycetota bacterium]